VGVETYAEDIRLSLQTIEVLTEESESFALRAGFPLTDSALTVTSD